MKVLPTTDHRHAFYCQFQKDIFGFYASNAGAEMDQLAIELRGEGFTHLDNLFGPIEIKSDNLGFTCRQAAAKSSSTDKIR